MVGSANVVQFDPNSKRRDQVLLSKLDLPIDRVREKSQLMLNAFFRVFFESVDDVLFEHADGAEDADTQNIYFEGMRSLRMQRNDILNAIQESIDHNFALLIDDGNVSPGSDPDSDARSLSSIHEDQINEGLALESFINSANLNNQQDLERLNKRFSRVLNKPLAQNSLPISPESLSELLSRQVQRADLLAEIKLVIYSELEQKLIEVLPALYISLNQVLAETGIMPELELQAIKQDLGSSKRSNRNTSNKKLGLWAQEHLKPLDDRVASVIESLVDKNKQIEVLPSQTLIGLLTTAQHSVSFDTSMLGQKTSSVVANILKSHGATGRLTRTDSEAIKLVGLMFECLYREHRLALPVKMQLNRLQIPFIKVAISDKNLFKNAGHPAKLFLDKLAKLGQSLGASDKAIRKDNPLFEQLVKNVDAVMSEYDTDINLFKRLNTKFMKAIPLSGYSSSNIVISESASQEAKEAVDALLALTQQGKTSGVVSLFVDKVWKKVLIKAHAQYGSESEQWDKHVKTLEQLIWSVKVSASPQHRKDLIDALPSLNQQLQDGLRTVSYNPYEVAALLNSINQLHLGSIKRPQDQKRARDLDESETTQISDEQKEKIIAKTDPHMQMVMDINRGACFHLLLDSGEYQYCCLAAVIKQSDAYIFVNRSGEKVVQYTAVQFAQALKEGRLSSQGQGMAFDNALERVVTGLRRPEDGNE